MNQSEIYAFRLESCISIPEQVDLAICPIENIPALEWEGERTIGKPNWKKSVSVDGCLDEFIALANVNPDKAPERVYEFTKKRGILGIEPRVFRQDDAPEMHYREPISIYTRCANQMRSMLNIAEQLRRGEPVLTKLEWDSIRSSPLTKGEFTFLAQKMSYETSADTVHNQRRTLSMFVTQWLSYSGVRLSIADIDYEASSSEENPFCFQPVLTCGKWEDGAGWDEQRLQVTKLFSSNDLPLPSALQRPSPLFCLLVVQLNLALALPPGVFTCSNPGCGRLFSPAMLNRNNPAKTAKNTYCSEECLEEAKNIRRKEKRAKSI